MQDSVIVVYGAGGHGKVIGDLVLAAGHHLLGFVDDGHPVGHSVLTSPQGGRFDVLGGSDWLRQHRDRFREVALGIGDNFARQRIALSLSDDEISLATLVHPSAVVSRFSMVESGTTIMAQAAVNPDVRIGQGVIVNTGAVVEHDGLIGAFAHVSPNASMAGAAGLGAFSHLGTGAVILPGVTVGTRCIVGAGAVVHRNVPDGTVVVGVPARKIRQISTD